MVSEITMDNSVTFQAVFMLFLSSQGLIRAVIHGECQSECVLAIGSDRNKDKFSGKLKNLVVKLTYFDHHSTN